MPTLCWVFTPHESAASQTSSSEAVAFSPTLASLKSQPTWMWQLIHFSAILTCLSAYKWIEQHSYLLFPSLLACTSSPSSTCTYHSLPVYNIVLLGKLTSDLRCSFVEPAVFQLCFCSQKEEIQRARKKGVKAAVSPAPLDPLRLLTLNLRKMGDRGRAGCAYSLKTTLQPHPVLSCAGGWTLGTT